MQVAQILGEEYHEPLDLIHLAREGVSKTAMLQVQRLMELSQKEMAKLLHLTPRTLQRMKDEDKLPPSASGQLLELARVYSSAVEALGDTSLVRQWLRTPIRALNDEIPIHLLDTPVGIQWVNTILGRATYGVYS
ncbi:putative toxin-antitoxin system antitoxin component (TIGR02293 family) [Catalinimonas alkaloidigena]|uniref:type II RES/Xre toxin-antitoxin system antitoxin n=1 Tax=Catalinimonas alkaloidigena TaxID=1075417 RepID=UPI00240691CE|nr:antitoxin Xre-like helix-turn-helix domain-containing protein [Catalinimonas alkaloidigena]MDF9797378.1 putative toxin-antitoxin system antitoxin component (TIGR02293 family) [Catalinimonas alkaloidigena]